MLVQAVITDNKGFEGKLIKSKFGLDIISDFQDLLLLKFYKEMIKSEQLNITKVSKILSYMKSENGSNIVYDPKLKNFFEMVNNDGIDEPQDNLQKKGAHEKKTMMGELQRKANEMKTLQKNKPNPRMMQLQCPL